MLICLMEEALKNFGSFNSTYSIVSFYVIYLFNKSEPIIYQSISQAKGNLRKKLKI